MVHFPNATVTVAKVTNTVNAEGTRIKAYDFTTEPLETFRADVQPNTLTKEQIDLYGINEKTAETKKCFFDNASYMKSGNRVKVDYDDGVTEYYNICPENKWRVHSECLLVPVENE